MIRNIGTKQFEFASRDAFYKCRDRSVLVYEIVGAFRFGLATPRILSHVREHYGKCSQRSVLRDLIMLARLGLVYREAGRWFSARPAVDAPAVPTLRSQQRRSKATLRDHKKIEVRLPTGLYRMLKDEADQRRLSMNRLCIEKLGME